MFEIFGWSWAADAVSKLPKEVIYAGIGYLALESVTKRVALVKIEQAHAKTRQAELAVEELALKLELQKLQNLNPQ